VLVPRSHSTASILLYYAQHPLAFFQVLFATVGHHDIFTFYQQSFIGILGSLDVPLPQAAYSWLWAGLALCAAASIRAPVSAGEGQARAVLGALAPAAIALVFLALLVAWTPHPAQVVNGVQGRYFIVPAILLAYLLGGSPAVPMARARVALTAGVAGGFALLSLVALVQALLTRYH